MPTFHHDGIDFAYETLGEGPPVVLCHGLSGDRSQIKELLGDLSGYRFVFADSRGHGDTQPLGPESKLCFSQFASDLSAILDHLEIDRAVIGGSSMGAAISARFALDFPDRVRALALMRPAWCDSKSPEGLKWTPIIGRLLQEHGAEEGRKLYDDNPALQSLRAEHPVEFESFRDQFNRPQAAERYARLVRIPADCPIRDWQEVESIEVPTLVIGNEKDSVHPLAFAEQWAAHLKNARLEQVPPKSIDADEHNRIVRGHLQELLASL